MLLEHGCTGEALKIALGVIYVEGDGYLATKNYGFPAVYYDAVGDIAGARLGPYPTQAAAEADWQARAAAGKQVPRPVEYHQLSDGWYAVNPIWGCSLTQWQIRALDDPSSGNAADTWRVAEKLHGDPVFATQAARAISKNWTDFTPWSAYKSDNWKEFADKDFKLVPGHPNAEKWSY